MATPGLGHHSPSASLLLNRNTASRPGSPSSGPSPLTMSSQSKKTHHHSSSAGSDHSNSSSSSSATFDHNDNSNFVGRYTEKDDSYFPTVDVTNGTGSLGNYSSKRSRFGLYSGPNGIRRWRWWNYTAAVLMIFALVQALILLIGSTALYSLPDQIQIGRSSLLVFSPVLKDKGVFFSGFFSEQESHYAGFKKETGKTKNPSWDG